MVEVEILRPFWHEGRPVQAGQVVALDTPTAAYVVGLGRAAYIVEREPAAQEPATKPQRRRAAKVPA